MAARTITLTEEEIRNIEAPAFTKTWAPIPHRDVIDNLNLLTSRYGLEVVNRRYEVSKDGKNMFGTWVLPAEGSDRAQTLVGFRNSMSKMFALGVVAGANVMVCSNLQFSSDEFLESRRHTAGLADPEVLRDFLSNAVQHVRERGQIFREWIDNLDTYQTTLQGHKLLAYDMMVQGALPPSKFEAYRESLKLEIEDNSRASDLVDAGRISAGHVYGAVTRTLRESSANQIRERTKVLNKTIEKYLQSDLFERI